VFVYVHMHMHCTLLATHKSSVCHSHLKGLYLGTIIFECNTVFVYIQILYFFILRSLLIVATPYLPPLKEPTNRSHPISASSSYPSKLYQKNVSGNTATHTATNCNTLPFSSGRSRFCHTHPRTRDAQVNKSRIIYYQHISLSHPPAYPHILYITIIK